jgi:hypothetical protein
MKEERKEEDETDFGKRKEKRKRKLYKKMKQQEMRSYEETNFMETQKRRKGRNIGEQSSRRESE